MEIENKRKEKPEEMVVKLTKTVDVFGNATESIIIEVKEKDDKIKQEHDKVKC